MKNRPLSPHLKIYTAQFTSIFSIFHRISGSFLYMFFVSYLVHFHIYNFLSYFWVSYSLFSIFLSAFFNCVSCVLLFLIGIFYFHALNGFRHLYLDKFCGLYFPFVDNSGVFISFAVIFLTILNSFC